MPVHGRSFPLTRRPWWNVLDQVFAIVAPEHANSMGQYLAANLQLIVDFPHPPRFRISEVVNGSVARLNTKWPWPSFTAISVTRDVEIVDVVVAHHCFVDVRRMPPAAEV